MGTQQCLNCSGSFTGKYCNNCGEKVYDKHDKSVSHLLEEVFHFFTHFEGKFFQSLKALFTRPGLLSYDYCRGLRKKYFKPVSLYILVVVIYLLFPLMQGLNMPLKSYQGQKYYSSIVQHTINKKIVHNQISFEDLSHLFEKKSEKLSKILLVLILPLCAFVLLGLWFNKKDAYFFDHFILSAEINSFFILLIFFILPILVFIISLFTGSTFIQTHLSEATLLPYLFASLVLYAAFAFRRMYNSSFMPSLLKAVVFCLMQFFIVFTVYKFLLFTSVMLLL